MPPYCVEVTNGSAGFLESVAEPWTLLLREAACRVVWRWRGAPHFARLDALVGTQLCGALIVSPAALTAPDTAHRRLLKNKKRDAKKKTRRRRRKVGIV